MNIKRKYVILGLVLLIIAWVGNIYYYENHKLKKPLFIKHYYDIKNGMDFFRLYFIDNINEKNEISYVSFPELEDGYISADILNYNRFRFYKPIAASPSDVRQFSLWMMDCTNGDNREYIANELTGGAFNIKKGQFMNLKNLVNMMVRIGLWVAPSKLMGEVPGVLLVEEKIKNYIKHKDKDGNLVNGETWDGCTFWKAEYTAKMFSNILSAELEQPVVVTPNAVIGSQSQNRITVVNDKDSGKHEDIPVFNMIRENMENRYKTRVIGDPNNVVAKLI
jgi:hypothetical protein